MTAQAMEPIYIDGKKHYMAAEPIGDYLEKIDHPPKLLAENMACLRGYYGNWKIKDDKLFLTGLDAYIATGDDDVTWEVVGLDYFFPNKKMVLADWFTGEIRVPMGELLSYGYASYFNIYEKDLIIDIEKGVVVNKTVVENTTEPDINLILK